MSSGSDTKGLRSLLQTVRSWRKPDSETLSAYLFLLPNIVGFLVFTAIPVGAAFLLAFFIWDPLLGTSFAGLENFRRLTTDGVFHDALFNTFYFTFATVPLSTVLGLIAALLVNKVVRGVVVFRTVLLLPFVVLTVAIAAVWRWLYRPNVGLINSTLAIFGIDGPSWLTSSAWAMPALIILATWQFFGYNMVLFLAGLQSIPQQLYEAADVDGAGAWTQFRHITLPMLSPTTFFVVIISIINSFQVFDQAIALTGGGPGTVTTTLVLYIYEVGFQSFELGYASAIALVLFAVIFVVTVLQFRLQRRWVHYE